MKDKADADRILTFDGFDELNLFIAAAILNRLKPSGRAAHITAPTERVTSMNGLTVERQRPLEFIAEADAVIIGSGIRTREIAADAALLARLRLAPERQLIGAQCSGTLPLARLGLVGTLPACTDLTTKPWVGEAGVDVLDAPFGAHVLAGGAKRVCGGGYSRRCGMTPASNTSSSTAPSFAPTSTLPGLKKGSLKIRPSAARAVA